MTPTTCAPQLTALALPGLPIVQPGDDLADLIRAGLARAELVPRAHDILVVASKLVSRAEDRFVDLATISPSAPALELAARTGHDPRHVELILRESAAISRVASGVLIVRHRLGFVVANAGVDLSNAAPPGFARGAGPWALCLPRDPDASARRLRAAFADAPSLGVVISDSFGRPFRLGTVGTAIGAAGLPATNDHRGRADLFGRPLEHTVTALADQVAAVADLVAGQADEGRGVVLIRGLQFASGDDAGASSLLRSPHQDLYA